MEPTQYFSTRISEMPTNHILNAVNKIRVDTDQEAVGLLVELATRYQTEIEELTRENATLWAEVSQVPCQLSCPVYRGVDPDTLQHLRSLAMNLIRRYGSVTADSLRQAYACCDGEDIGPELPFVFRDKRFRKIGFLRSTYRPNNGRFICVWGGAR